MNIFVLDSNPRLAAQYHCDSHVVKMVLESAQLLSTVHHKCGTWCPPMYKPTHQQHPCSLWLMESQANYIWCWQLLDALCVEYTFRYGRLHATSQLVDILANMPVSLPDVGLTQFALAMPDVYRGSDAVTAYRGYYRGAKSHILKYRGRLAPPWLTQVQAEKSSEGTNKIVDKR